MNVQDFAKLSEYYGREKAAKALKWFCATTSPELKAHIMNQFLYVVENEYLWFPN